MTDELRDQIQRLDPMHADVPTDPVTAPSSRELLENIMSTPVSSKKAPEPAEEEVTVEPAVAPVRLGRPWYALAAAALVAVVAIGGIALFTGGDDSTPGTSVIASPPLELGLGDGGASASCMVVSAEVLRGMSPAFLGTATAVDGEQVTLSVDRWYAGDEYQSVVLTAPAGMEALTGGIDFQIGEQYFITAFDGVVNYCGYSDAYSPELESIYEEAFGS
jgi:hypothetical protein